METSYILWNGDMEELKEVSTHPHTGLMCDATQSQDQTVVFLVGSFKFYLTITKIRKNYHFYWITKK